MGDKEKEYEIWLDEFFKSTNADADGTYEINIGNITVDNHWSSDGREYDDWLVNNIFDNNTHDDITLTGGGEEMIRVAKDGFYVRGVRVEADAKEAEQVYKAFKEWLTWANLSKNTDN